MITITINRSVAGIVESFTISGHAEFAEHGHDIVCAGVSAVSVGTINAIEVLTRITLHTNLGEDGYLHCDIPIDMDEGAKEKVQLLLEGMIVSLQTIQVEYEKYVKIKIND